MTVLSILISLLFLQQPSVLDALRQKAAVECVCVDYEYSTLLSGFKTVGNGSVEIQGNSYHMKGNGMEIYCDGSTTWLIDEIAQEVLIESADTKEAGILANPILLLMHLEESSVTYEVKGDTVVLNLPDGTSLDIKINKMLSAPFKKSEAFRPPTEFSGNWIVTDLR